MIDFRGRSFNPQNKLVTVAVASYNNASYVISTLESIYNQTYAPIELRIIDDASADNSVAIIREWIAKKELVVQFTLNERNRGVCYACNSLIKQAAYYLVLIGSDDEMEVDRLEKQIAYFQTLSNEYGLVYSDMSTIDENGSLVEASWLKSRDVMPLDGDVFELFLREKLRFPSPSIVYRSEVFKTVGDYDERLISEDIDMLLRILRHYKVAYCPILSVRYRVLAKSLSNNMGERFYKDRITIYSKFLGISEGVDTYVKSKIVGWAQRAYFSDYAESKSLLLQSVKIQFTMKSFLLLLFAWCGVRYKQLSKVIKLVNN